MASLVIDTNNETHPQISIDILNLRQGYVTFRWLNGPHGGDNMEPWTITLEDDGEKTVNELVTEIKDQMIAKLEGGND